MPRIFITWDSSKMPRDSLARIWAIREIRADSHSPLLHLRCSRLPLQIRQHPASGNAPAVLSFPAISARNAVRKSRLKLRLPAGPVPVVPSIPANSAPIAALQDLLPNHAIAVTSAAGNRKIPPIRRNSARTAATRLMKTISAELTEVPTYVRHP